jgi:copper(I)-binding protein
VAGQIHFVASANAMVHETALSNGVAKMEHARLTIGVDSTTELVPGGVHIMLMGLSSPLVEGCRYEFSVTWLDGRTTNHEFVTGGYGQMAPPGIEGRLCL